MEIISIPTEFWISDISYTQCEKHKIKVELRILEDNKKNAVLVFYGVSNFKFCPTNGLPLLLFGVVVDDISKYGWEGVRYKVYQVEQGLLEFFCESIETR